MRSASSILVLAAACALALRAAAGRQAGRALPPVVRRRAREPEGPPATRPLPDALIATVLAVGVEAGLAPEPVLAVVADRLARLGHPLAPGLARLVDDPATALGEAFADDLGQALRLARVAGVPPASLVRQAGLAQRRRERAERRAALSRLPVLLVLPSGLLLLPAAIALGIVPVVIDLLQRTLGS